MVLERQNSVCFLFFSFIFLRELASVRALFLCSIKKLIVLNEKRHESSNKLDKNNDDINDNIVNNNMKLSRYKKTDISY